MDYVIHKSKITTFKLRNPEVIYQLTIIQNLFKKINLPDYVIQK